MKLGQSFWSDLLANVLAAILFAFLTWLWSHRKLNHMHDHLKSIQKTVDSNAHGHKENNDSASNSSEKRVTVVTVKGGI